MVVDDCQGRGKAVERVKRCNSNSGGIEGEHTPFIILATPKEVIQMAKFFRVLVAAAMVTCGAIALYITFAPVFRVLLNALPF
jgi:hypothetical protein